MLSRERHDTPPRCGERISVSVESCSEDCLLERKACLNCTHDCCEIIGRYGSWKRLQPWRRRISRGGSFCSGDKIVPAPSEAQHRLWFPHFNEWSTAGRRIRTWKLEVFHIPYIYKYFGGVIIIVILFNKYLVVPPVRPSVRPSAVEKKIHAGSR